MCIISKRIKASQIREKRQAIRKKVQSDMNSPINKNSMFQPHKIFFPQLLAKVSVSPSTDNSQSELILNGQEFELEVENEFFQKYEILEKIGEGAHSSVYKCKERASGKIFAVKQTRYRDEQMILNSKSNYEFNKLLSNDSIVRFQQLIVDEKKMITYNVQEFCGFRNLKDELFSKPTKKFTQFETLSILKALLETMVYIHSKNMCHRDIKPQNILYNPEDSHIKVIDLECSKSKKETDSQFEMWTKTGTLNYQAPQYFLNTTYTQKVDIWAAGVLAYELLTGKLPFYSPYHHKTVQQIIQTEIDFQGLKLSTKLEKLLKGLLNKEASKRFTAREALSCCKEAFDSIQSEN